MLPDSLRTQHIAMFASLSLQGASYQHPRMILASPRAHFVMTFNGHPSQPGFEAVETMRFTRIGKARFIFEEIVFPDDFAARKAHLSRVRDKKGLESLIDRKFRTGQNPGLCLSCHQSNPRPNWEHYPFWPGAYGQFDDRPFASESVHPLHTDQSAIPATHNKQAAEELPKFIAKAATRARYRHLLDLEGLQTLKDGPASNKKSNRTTQPYLSQLTHDFGIMNFDRIAQILEDSGDRLNAVRMLLAILKCPEVYAAYPEDGILFERYFKDTDIDWQNFFMNLYASSKNSLNAPLRWRQQATYSIIQKFPEYAIHFQSSYDNYPPFNSTWVSEPMGSMKAPLNPFKSATEKAREACEQLTAYLK